MSLASRIASQLHSARTRGLVWALPHVVLGVFVLALFALLALLRQYERDARRAALAQDVQWAEQSIRSSLAENQAFLQRMAQGIASGAVDERVFHAQTAVFVADSPEITHVAWVDADQVVRWVAPAESASWQRGERLSFPEQTLAFQRADRTGEPAYAVPPVEPEHRAAIEVHVPVTSALRFSGTVVGLYAADELLRHVTPQWFFEKYRVVLENDDRVFSASSAVTAKTDVAESVSLDPPGHGLRLRVSAYALDSHVHFAIAVAFIGGLVVLMAWSLWALGAHTQRRLRAERERDELSDAVRRDHAFRKAMEESVVTGLRAVDMDGRITYVNPAFCEMVGFSAEELLGATPPFPYWPEEELAELHEVTRRWMRGEAPRSGFEVRIRRKSGERFPARMYISPLIDGDGRQTGWMGSMVDISEQKRAQELAQQHQDRVQQTSRLIAMGEMASSLAHELNQPLAAIANYCRGSVNHLRADRFDLAAVTAAMEKASAQAERAGTIIRRMRDFVNKREPNRAAVPVVEVVEEALGFAEIDARKAGVAIVRDVPSDLPPIYADRVMIEQVLLNLVKNAIEATQGTEGRREVAVTARPDGGRAVEVAVVDRGRGFEPEQADKLFLPFYTTKPDGMGMGLSICRSIVEFHGGRLWAQPNPAGGSVFRFTLPIC